MPLIYVILIIVLFCLSAAFTYILSRRQEQRQIEHINDLLKEVSQLRLRERLKHMEEAQNARQEESGSQTAEEAINETLENEQEDDLFIARVTELVYQRIPHGLITIESAASIMGMSVSTFRRRIIAITGESPKTFFLAIQMSEAARKLLKYPNKPLKVIADECGFSEVGSFARTFKRVFGMTPTEYREQAQKTTNQS